MTTPPDDWHVLEGGEATAAAFSTWLVDAVNRLGRGELDEAVYFLHCRGGSYRFSVQAFRQDQPDAVR